MDAIDCIKTRMSIRKFKPEPVPQDVLMDVINTVVAKMYNVVMSGSVYKEITANSYPGAEEYRQLMAGKKITLKEPLPDISNESILPGLNNLDKGEHDVLQLYYAGRPDREQMECCLIFTFVQPLTTE